jgi:hypothetical protein
MVVKTQKGPLSINRVFGQNLAQKVIYTEGSLFSKFKTIFAKNNQFLNQSITFYEEK